MSASENKQLMKDIFAGLAVGDGALFVAHLADDVALTVTGSNSWSQIRRGKETLLTDHYRYVWSLLREPGKTCAYRFLADGDWVVVEAKGDMVTKAGKPYQNDYCLMYRLENGKIKEIKEYLDSWLCEEMLGPFPKERKNA